MGYHVPVAFRCAIFAYVTLVVIRPVLLGRLGTRLPLRHLQPPRLGVEHRLPVPALPLQPGAHARGQLLLHHHLRAVAARRPGPVGRQPAEGRAGEDGGAREHLLPRHHRLFGRHARHPPARPVPGPVRRLLERGLHHHLRPVLDPRLAGMVELVARTCRSGAEATGRRHEETKPDSASARAGPRSRKRTWPSIRTSSPRCRSAGRPTPACRSPEAHGREWASPASATGSAASATRRSGRSISAGSASPR